MPPMRDEEQRQQRKRRSRFGCNNCRARKVKCDERPNGCANCERLRLECSGYHQPRSTSSTAGQSPATDRSARRTYRSCNGCRIAKSKCSGERPVCARCRDSSIRCSYQDAAERASSQGREPDTMSNDGSEVGYPNLRTSVPASRSANSQSHLPWLSSPELPDPKQIRVLVNYYFQNVHTLRCYAFIHKPSFLRRLDDELASGSHKTALLYIICTLGAQFFAMEYSDTVQHLPTKAILLAGSHWAKTAQRLLLENLQNISIENLMTTQLLYDFSLRMANFAQAFMLSALMMRMTQALQINLEYSTGLLSQCPDTGLSITTRECRRRLMWSCYVTDALCGSGVDQLTLINEEDLKIQLPCKDWNFLYEQPCITTTLNGSALEFLPPEVVPADLDANMGMLAYFVQHIVIRKRVLRYIKHLDTAKLPWFPDSEFALLDNELRKWYGSLPASLEFTTTAIYIRKESCQVNALCLLHCAYHQTMCDLYRIGAPALYKLRSAFQFPPEQSHFLKHLQWSLFEEAKTLAAILAETERHGPGMIGDTWLPTIAYDSNRIMLYYLTQIVDPVEKGKKDIVLNTVPYLQSNVQALKTMRATNAIAEGLYRAAESMLEKLGVDSNSIRPCPSVVLDDPYLVRLDPSRRSAQGTVSQTAPDYVLNPLSIFRMARNDIPEGHAPDGTLPPSNDLLTPANTGSTGDVPNLSNAVDELHRANNIYGSMEGISPNLDMFFTSDLDWDWQPAETVVGSGMEGGGLLPWVGTSQFSGSAFMPSQ